VPAACWLKFECVWGLDPDTTSCAK
jgi:hypothetical protein